MSEAKTAGGTAPISQEMKDFLYTVSHDLESPLRAMVEFSRLMKVDHPEALDEEAQLYLSLIVDNGEKLQRMIGSLWEYFYISNDDRAFETVFCEEVVAACRKALENPKAKIEVAALPPIHAKSEQIKKLFTALLQNALTFHAPGNHPHIVVAAEEQGDIVLFSVRDNGFGIDPRFHERIFMPFKRLHPDNEFPGIGMGLTLAKRIVDNHGGRIWVESKLGGGTTIKFTLPGKP